nr:NlpC/P60 family protein [Candidatus Jettenia sp. AMX1]
MKSEGADCIQFIVAVAKELGWLPADYKTIKYARDWSLHNNRSILLEEISKVCVEVRFASLDELRAGDVLVFMNGQTSGYGGIYIGEGRMIHAHIRHGIQEDPVSRYQEKLNSVWRVSR